MWFNLRVALRFYKHPLAITAVLALGIGVSTFVFTIVDALFLRPLPFADSGRLYHAWAHNRAVQIGTTDIPPTYSDIRLWQQTSTTFEHVSAFRPIKFTLTGGQASNRYNAAFVTRNFFKTLGIRPGLGTGLDEISASSVDETSTSNDVVVVSARLHASLFGGRQDVLGQSVLLDGKSYTIAGVMPDGFHYPRGNQLPAAFGSTSYTDLWVPFPFREEDWQNRRMRNAIVLIKLRSAVPLSVAQEELDRLSSQQATLYPRTHKGWTTSLTPMKAQVLGGFQSALTLLVIAAGLLVLLAFGNALMLVFARVYSQKRDHAVRSALGASRLHVIAHIVAETASVCVIGSILGLVLCFLGIHILQTYDFSAIPRIEELRLTSSIIWGAATIAALVTVAAALFASITMSGSNTYLLLRTFEQGGHRGGGRARSLLLFAEVTVCVALLSCTAVLLKGYYSLTRVNPGFSAEGVVTAVIKPSWRHNAPEQVSASVEDVLEQLSVLPGVRSVGATTYLPLAGADALNTVQSPDSPVRLNGNDSFIEDRGVTEDYFTTMNIGLIAGRLFARTDTRDAPQVVILNQRAAQTLFPGEDAVGKRIQLGGSAQATDCADCNRGQQVIGVVQDVRHRSLESMPRMQVYRPYAQAVRGEITIALKVSSEQQTLEVPIRAVTSKVDPGSAVSDVRTMSAVIERSLSSRRFVLHMLVIFGGAALVLTIAGLYGTISYFAVQRATELGIRAALGATPIALLRFTAGDSVRAVVPGLLCGILLYLLIMPVLSSLSYVISTKDPACLGGAVMIVLMTALIAMVFAGMPSVRHTPPNILRAET